MIQRVLFFISCFLLFSPTYGTYLFISSNPSGAKVSIIKENGKTETIGKTPMKMTNFAESTKVILEIVDYYSQTNTVSASTKVQSCNFILSPFSFDIQFPDLNQQTFIKANGKSYANMDTTLTLPFGNYTFSHSPKDGSFNAEYKSPYMPYLIFFSSITGLAAIAATVGGVLAYQSYQRFETAQTPEELLPYMSSVAIWDTFTWSSVGIGTGALIGTIVTASLEARDRKRIKRFNGMNSPNGTARYFAEFHEIVALSTINEREALSKISDFIRNYAEDSLPLVPDVYIRRAGIYLQQKKYKQAIADLTTVMEDYPMRATYELSAKMIGDTYFSTKDYKDAYEFYTEALKVQMTYTFEEIQDPRLDALFILAQSNKSYQELYLEETESLSSQLSGTVRNKINERRKNFL